MKKVLGIDLGDKSAKMGVINQFGEIEKQVIIPNDKEQILANLAKKTISQLENWGYDFNIDIERIGFATKGFLDHVNGIVKVASNLGWREYDVKTELKELFHNKPVSVLNNANAEALGEFWTGSASTYNSEIYYTFDTGIGGAIVIDGKLISGENGFAGEFGHGGYMQSKKSCNCGLRYCLEPTSSAIELINILHEHVKENPRSQIAKYFVNIKEWNFKNISDIYLKNNRPKEIKDFLLQILKPLFSHMSIMISALDPKAIIVGGLANVMSDALIEIIETGISPLILNVYKQRLRIDLAKLGSDAGIIGAAYYAINDWDY